MRGLRGKGVVMKLLSPPVVWLVVLTLVGVGPTYYAYWRGWLKRDYHRDVLAAALLALLAMLFFWRPIFDGNAWIPAGGGDMASMIYPNYHFVSESLKRGELPLWNPYLFCGGPFFADIQTGVFYPVNLAFWLLVRNVTYESVQWLVVFHFFLAGLFTYILLCALTTGPQKPLSRLAALTGAVAYMFSDILVTHIGNLNLIAVAAWLPLVFLLFHRAVVERRMGYAAAGGLATGIAFLAGHIQPFLYIALTLALYFALHLFLMGRNRATRQHLPRLLAVAVVYGVVGFGAMAVQFLPGRELADISVRSEMTYVKSTDYSLPPSQLIALLIPDFFGRGPGGYWGQWLRTETGYIGVFTLVAAGLALALNRNARRERLVHFLAGLAALGLLLALGGYTVLQGWVFELVPGFEKVRAPARFVMLFDFAVAVLAGLGVDALMKPLRRVERATLAGVTRVLGLGALLVTILLTPAMLVVLEMSRDQHEAVLARITGSAEGTAMFAVLLLASLGLVLARQQAWARRSTIGLLAVALVALDLISAGHDLEINANDPTLGYQHPTVVEFLRQDRDLYRVDTDTNVWDVWQPNAAPLHGIFEVQGGQHPMMLSSFRTYWSELGSRSTPLYDLLNVKYIVGKKGVPLDFSKWQLAFDADPQFSVYRNVDVMPRAFVVHNAVVQPEVKAHIDAMRQLGSELRETVVLEKGQPLNLGPIAARKSTASVSSYRNNEMVIDVDAATDGYLVLSEMYHDGWRATVDGRAAPVLRADYTFRAVPVASGKHQVRMYFSPISWETGRAISGFTWVGVLAWGLWALVRAIRRLRSGGAAEVKAGPLRDAATLEH